jgi:hypothetical protein
MIVLSPLRPDCEKRILCCWFKESVFNGIHDPELQFYCHETWFTLCGKKKKKKKKGLSKARIKSENLDIIPLTSMVS